MATRPTVTIATADGKPSGSTHPLPAVFRSPIRPDIVQYGTLGQPAMRREADTLLGVYTLAWQRTNGSHMLSVRKLVTRLRQNLGERVRVTPLICGNSFLVGMIACSLLSTTGRAVARIPRVSGGGTHRAGQAAFGNMCRSGRMFAPTKVWRKWHQKINLNQK